MNWLQKISSQKGFLDRSFGNPNSHAVINPRFVLPSEIPAGGPHPWRQRSRSPRKNTPERDERDARIEMLKQQVEPNLTVKGQPRKRYLALLERQQKVRDLKEEKKNKSTEQGMSIPLIE